MHNKVHLFCISRKNQFIYLGLFGLLIYFLIYIKSNKKMTNCLFCTIILGQTETTIEEETEDYVIFKDIKPASTYHYLAVPKKHIESMAVMTKNDIKTINLLDIGLRNFMQNKGINVNESLFGFHLPPFISVKHLHLHGIAPRSNMSFLSRFIFKPKSFWFIQVEEAKKYLQTKS